MAPKKQQYNEYYFFMLDKKPEVERRLGRKLGMNELAGLLHKEFKSLPPHEKVKYTRMKNESKSKREKLDCRGVPLREIEEAQEMQKKKSIEMRHEISSTVEMLKNANCLHKGVFYIVSTSYYIFSDELQKISPAEISVIAFSYEKGIIKEFHKIIKDNLPSGYKFEAVEHLKATHNLPLNNPEATDQINDVYDELCAFACQGDSNKTPPFYAMQEEIVQTENFLTYITDEPIFRVYCLEELFAQMYNVTFPQQSHALPITIAQNMLNECDYDYIPDIGCEVHSSKELDVLEDTIKLENEDYDFLENKETESVYSGASFSSSTVKSEGSVSVPLSSTPVPQDIVSFPKGLGRGTAAGLSIPSLSLQGIGRGKKLRIPRQGN